MTAFVEVPHTPGRILGIFTAESAGEPMRGHEQIEVIAGVGLTGDRYATRRGLYSTKHHDDRHLTILEDETLEALRRDHDLDLPPELTRRNLVVRGIGLNALVGGWLRIGPHVVVHIGRLNRPCRYLEKVTGLKVYEPLLHRSGVNCAVLVGGAVRVGDELVPVAPAR